MNTFPVGSRVAVIAGVNRGLGKIVGERTSTDRQQVALDNGKTVAINCEWIVSETAIKTRDVATTAVTSITAVLLDFGSKIVKSENTPGACGYTRLTYTIPSA